MRAFILTLSCPDRIGIVAAVSSFLAGQNCNILESAQFGDPDNGRFFLRTVFAPPEGRERAALTEAFAPIAREFAMDARFYTSGEKLPTLILVSRQGHCLNDLLFQWRIGHLPIDIKAIISNHEDFRAETEAAGLPFVCLPITPETKAAQEAALTTRMREVGAELIVLARYMQVLTAEFCATAPGQIINIHHSFLPGFKGAKPYHRAHARGVKLIGATAHYVTADLDEGPIIEQAVERVHHGHSVRDFIATGRDIEASVLTRAVKWHAERRVLLNQDKTIVFA